jgi:hypothetical protein
MSSPAGARSTPVPSLEDGRSDRVSCGRGGSWATCRARGWSAAGRRRADGRAVRAGERRHRARLAVDVHLAATIRGASGDCRVVRDPPRLAEPTGAGPERVDAVHDEGGAVGVLAPVETALPPIVTVRWRAVHRGGWRTPRAVWAACREWRARGRAGAGARVVAACAAGEWSTGQRDPAGASNPQLRGRLRSRAEFGTPAVLTAPTDGGASSGPRFDTDGVLSSDPGDGALLRFGVRAPPACSRTRAPPRGGEPEPHTAIPAGRTPFSASASGRRARKARRTPR